jgi:hypothetical protein
MRGSIGFSGKMCASKQFVRHIGSPSTYLPAFTQPLQSHSVMPPMHRAYRYCQAESTQAGVLCCPAFTRDTGPHCPLGVHIAAGVALAMRRTARCAGKCLKSLLREYVTGSP